MSSLLVQICSQIPHLGVLSSVAENQENSKHDCDGPIYGPGYYLLHCTEHIIYGHGTSANGERVRKNVVCGKPGKLTGDLCECFYFISMAFIF